MYPETIEKEAKEDDDIDLEEMLKRELEGMSAKAKKSNRFSECVHIPKYSQLTIRIMPARHDMRHVHMITATRFSLICSFLRDRPGAA